MIDLKFKFDFKFKNWLLYISPKKKMRGSERNIILTVLLLALTLVMVHSTNYACTTQGASGCTSCSDPAYLIIYNSDTSNYTCTDVTNCISVNNLSECT